jgi:AraC-like DNA-binding protein
MAPIDLVTDVLETLSARCAIAGHRSGSGDWLIRSPPPGRVKILAISRGALWFRVVGEPEAFLVSTGEAVILDGLSEFEFGTRPDMAPTRAFPGDPVSLLSADDRNVCVTAHIEVSGGSDAFLQGAVPGMTHVRADSAAGRAIAWLLGELDVEMNHDLPASRRAAEQIVELLFVHVIRVWMTDGMTLPAGWIRLLREPFLLPAARLIHSQPRFPVTVSELARSCGLSRTVFIERFRASAGVPPATYIFNWKMRLATNLLETTDTPVEQIAHQLGYSSASSFNVAFKRWIGLTPGKKRKLASRRSAAEIQTAAP